jgi:hypothetical protein
MKSSFKDFLEDLREYEDRPAWGKSLNHAERAAVQRAQLRARCKTHEESEKVMAETLKQMRNPLGVSEFEWVGAN